MVVTPGCVGSSRSIRSASSRFFTAFSLSSAALESISNVTLKKSSSSNSVSWFSRTRSISCWSIDGFSLMMIEMAFSWNTFGRRPMRSARRVISSSLNLIVLARSRFGPSSSSEGQSAASTKAIANSSPSGT